MFHFSYIINSNNRLPIPRELRRLRAGCPRCTGRASGGKKGRLLRAQGWELSAAGDGGGRDEARGRETTTLGTPRSTGGNCGDQSGNRLLQVVLDVLSSI